jgi:hypothetical protein
MTDLETRLRQAGDDLRLDRPVEDVIARGTALRRRRRLSQAVVASGAVIAAAALVPVLASFTADSSGDPASTGAPPMVRLSPAELDAADTSCRVNVPETILDEKAEVFGADKYGNDAVVLYRTPGPGATGYGVCNVTDGGAVAWGGELRGPGRLEMPTDQRPLAPDEATLLDVAGDGSGILLDVGLAGDSVTRVVAEVGTDTIVASVDDGWYWFGTAMDHAAGDDSTPKIRLRAYDASDEVVDEVVLPAMVSITDPVTGR